MNSCRKVLFQVTLRRRDFALPSLRLILLWEQFYVRFLSLSSNVFIVLLITIASLTFVIAHTVHIL
jgi:hypothetical protein